MIKKYLKKLKTCLIPLKSTLPAPEELLDKKLLNRLRKSKYETDKLLFKLVNLSDSKFIFNEHKAPNRADYVEKREIDRFTSYSFDGPFHLLHADVGKLEFLVTVDLFSSKVYTYSIKSRKQILQKLKRFHDDVRNKRKGKKMRLQVNKEFQ